MDTTGAQPNPNASPVLSGARTLLVRLGERVIGLDTRVTRGVVSLDGLTTVPRATLPLLGLVGVRGSIVPVVDLAPLVEATRTGNTDGTAVLVESGGETFAFPVDEVVGFTTADAPAGGALLTPVQEFGGRTFDYLDLAAATAAVTARITLT